MHRYNMICVKAMNGAAVSLLFDVVVAHYSSSYLHAHITTYI